MSEKYALSRVQDALDASQQSPAKAEKMIYRWLEKDQSLLLGLITPYIKAIVKNAINHQLYGAKKAQIPTNSKKENTKNLSAGEMGELGQALISSKNAPKFGQGAGLTTSAAKEAGKTIKASARHVDAIHALAKKSKKDD
jgi:hypothetical protein